MMLNEKGAVIAQRLGLDIVVDKVAKSLTAVGVGASSSRLCAAEQSEFHRTLLILLVGGHCNESAGLLFDLLSVAPAKAGVQGRRLSARPGFPLFRGNDEVE